MSLPQHLISDTYMLDVLDHERMCGLEPPTVFDLFDEQLERADRAAEHGPRAGLTCRRHIAHMSGVGDSSPGVPVPVPLGAGAPPLFTREP